MIQSLVVELQSEALSNGGSITGLIRKAFVLSRKLELDELSVWLKNEMEGYQNVSHENIPCYRYVQGHLKAWNPYRGFIPAIISGDKENEWSRQPLLQSLSEIESLIDGAKKMNSDILEYKFPPALQMKWMKSSGVAFETSLHIPVPQFENVTNRVRDIILEWTLDLEGRGIKGENMTFSDNEKKSATQITNIYNHIGTMMNSQIQQSSDNSVQTISGVEFKIESLKEIIEQGKELLNSISEEETREELKAELMVLEAQAFSPKPKKNIIKESLQTIRSIAEGVTGSMVATGILQVISLLLASL
ncbi:hypothetical protein [Metasolibacillus meyeri]|uniref:AbiTii domain-containing protein n=1 Tax=Metasolibacillus meyeri TaxID=1071052 RepID=UPI000D302FCD|nr:hypothetical protein [Metasolibacillus meyeri]